MRIALTTPIEGYRCTSYFYFFLIGFNIHTILELLYDEQVYGNSSIYPDLGNQVGDFVRILIFVLYFIV